MELIEQTSERLILKGSTVSTWMIRLICTPFLMLGLVGIWIVIIEKIFPSFFIIFCLIAGFAGVFLTSTQMICLDKPKNQLRIKTTRLLSAKTLEYPLDHLQVRIERTWFSAKTSNSIFNIKKEPICILVLETASSPPLKISSNYSLTRSKAVKIADQIRTFLNPKSEFQVSPFKENEQEHSPSRLHWGSWIRRMSWFVPLILANILWINFGNTLPWVQQWGMDCSQEAVQSPYCDFAVAHTLTAHPRASVIAISDDGKLLVSGGKDKAIKVWDLQTGTLKNTLQSNSGEIYAVAIAPDNKTVVSGSSDRRIRIWDMTLNVPPKVLQPHTLTVKQVEISSDGTTLISHSDNELKAWDLATGELKATLTLPFFRLLDINRETKTALLQLADNKVVLWNATTNQQNILPKMPHGLMRASISRDGQTLVGIVAPQFRIARKRSERDLRIWDLATSTLKAEERAGRDILATALSRTHLFTSTPEGIKVWNLQTADLEATLNQQKLKHLVVSADGKLLAGMISDRSHHITQIQVLQRP